MERPLPRRCSRLLADRTVGRLRWRSARGSSEIFQPVPAGRPQAGINFITAHDGFTLRDSSATSASTTNSTASTTTTGHNHNFSWNCGAEGETTIRRFVNDGGTCSAPCWPLFRPGVPMLQGGDELGRTQSGNNNAYRQDNVPTWLDWHASDTEDRFTRGLIAIRKRFPQLRRSTG